MLNFHALDTLYVAVFMWITVEQKGNGYFTSIHAQQCTNDYHQWTGSYGSYGMVLGKIQILQIVLVKCSHYAVARLHGMHG